MLVVVDPGDAFSRYYAEILRAEGLNEFTVAEQSAVRAQTLAAYQVVLLAEADLSAGQASTLDGWVRGGATWSRCVPARRSRACSASGPARARRRGVPAGAAAARGHGQTMQYHGRADRWTAPRPRAWRRCSRRLARGRTAPR